MKADDLVRFKQPFIPRMGTLQVYYFGIVVGVVSEESTTQVLVYLYDLESSTFYTDESDIQAIYSFQLNEIEYVGNRPLSKPDTA